MVLVGNTKRHATIVLPKMTCLPVYRVIVPPQSRWHQEKPLRLHRLGYRHGYRHGGAHHGVVAHADKAHHFNVGGHGGAACKLGVGMHTAHGVGHAVGGGAGSHVVGVQGTASAAAGSNGKVLLAVLDAPLLVGACDRVLKAGGVGGVARNGNIHALMAHYGHALVYVVSAIAAHVGTLALTVGGGLGDSQLAGVLIVLGLAVSEAVDTGDDLCSVLAETVQDNLQGLLADLVWCGLCR